MDCRLLAYPLSPIFSSCLPKLTLPLKRILKLTKGSTSLARGEELEEARRRRWLLPFLLAYHSQLGEVDDEDVYDDDEDDEDDENNEDTGP